MKSSNSSPILGAWNPLELITGLLAQKRFVIAGTVGCMIVAFAASFLLSKTYESSAGLLLLPPPVKEVKDKNMQTMGLFTKVLGVRDYCVLLESDGVLRKVADRIREQNVLPEKDMKEVEKLSFLRKSTKIVTTVVEKTAYASALSPAITLQTQGPSPEAAMLLAQTWAEVAVEQSVAFYAKGKEKQMAFIAEQLKQTEADMNKILDEQQAVDTQYDNDSARAWLMEMSTLLTTTEGLHVVAQADLATQRQEAAELRLQIEKQPQKFTLFQSPPATALFLEQALGKDPAVAEDPTQVRGYQKEEVNLSYVETSNLLVLAEKGVKGLEDRERTLAQSLEQMKQEIATEREKFAKFFRERKRLENQYTVVCESYKDLAERLIQARVAETEEADMGDLRLASEAVIVRTPISPNPKLIVAAAMVVGFCAFALIALYRVLVAHLAKLQSAKTAA